MRKIFGLIMLYFVMFPVASQVFVDPPSKFSATQRETMAKITLMFGEIASQAEQKNIAFVDTEAYGRVADAFGPQMKAMAMEFLNKTKPYIRGRDAGSYLANFMLHDITLRFLYSSAPLVGAKCNSVPEIDVFSCHHKVLQELIDNYK
jgi:hypothetical protein